MSVDELITALRDVTAVDPTAGGWRVMVSWPADDELADGLILRDHIASVHRRQNDSVIWVELAAPA
jgi:hypothetical protein